MVLILIKLSNIIQIVNSIQVTIILNFKLKSIIILLILII